MQAYGIRVWVETRTSCALTSQPRNYEPRDNENRISLSSSVRHMGGAITDISDFRMLTCMLLAV